MSEFGERLKATGINADTFVTIEHLLNDAGKEFPCRTCPSKDEWASFKWFLKWFGA